MGVHVFPILNPHTHLPPHPIPLGHPSAPAPSTLYHASNLAWRFISHMIIYMFQCHCLKSCHPRPLPQSPKDCSIHIYIYTHMCMYVYIMGYYSIIKRNKIGSFYYIFLSFVGSSHYHSHVSCLLSLKKTTSLSSVCLSLILWLVLPHLSNF